MMEQDPLIAEYSHERFRPREDEALFALRKVASVVKPIMRARGWRVGVLTEFYPPEANLLGLNWNKGQKICLRLRYPGDERQFLPFQNVVDTMLHELAHIVHGPHDAAFHALWDQLRDEHEALVMKGYTGEGFLSTGRKLGGTGRIPMHEARRRARAAAEQRRTRTAGSGQKLGGRPVLRGVDIRAVIADAAQRRASVTRGCATADDADVDAAGTKRRGELVEEVARTGHRTKAGEDDATERAIMDAYIELIQEEERARFGGGYVPPSQADPLGSQGRRKAAEEQAKLELEAARGAEGPAPAVPSHSKPKRTKTSRDDDNNKPALAAPTEAIPQPQTQPAALSSPSNISSASASASAPEPDTWTCDVCTLHNPPTFLVCDACGTERSFLGGAGSAGASTDLPFATGPSATATQKARMESSTAIERAERGQRARTASARVAQYKQAEQSRPLGWLCGRCGTFMETEWWSCARCGAVKESS